MKVKKFMIAIAKDKNLFLLSVVLSFIFCTFWYLNNFEVHYYYDSSRWNTLKKILEMANEGYFFQYEKNVPMEIQWEDPGMAFWTLIYGVIKIYIFNSTINIAQDPYIVQYLICLFVFLFCLYELKDQKIFIVIPIAIFVVSTSITILNLLGYNFFNHNILYLSYGMHWTKVLSAFLLFTFIFKFNVIIDKEKIINFKELIIIVFKYGILFGFLKFLRNDTFVPILIFFIIYFIINFKNIFYVVKNNFLKVNLLIIIFILSLNINLIFAEQIWKLRDNIYKIEGYNNNSGHPMWHVLIMSLGHVPNKYNLTWSDRSAHLLSEKILNRKLKYGSSEHERMSKIVFFKIIKEEPLLLLKNILYKLNVLINDLKFKIPLILTILSFVIYFFKFNFKKIIQNKFFLIYPGFLAIPLLIQPYIYYFLDFVTISVLLVVYIGVSIFNNFVKLKIFAK